MSAFREAVNRQLLTTLHCPACDEHNRPSVKDLITLDQTGTIAICNVCDYSSAVEAFLPEKKAHT